MEGKRSVTARSTVKPVLALVAIVAALGTAGEEEQSVPGVQDEAVPQTT